MWFHRAGTSYVYNAAGAAAFVAFVFVLLHLLL